LVSVKIWKIEYTGIIIQVASRQKKHQIGDWYILKSLSAGPQLYIVKGKLKRKKVENI
jgi:hypothetical protein